MHDPSLSPVMGSAISGSYDRVEHSKDRHDAGFTVTYPVFPPHLRIAEVTDKSVTPRPLTLWLTDEVHLLVVSAYGPETIGNSEELHTRPMQVTLHIFVSEAVLMSDCVVKK